MPRVLPCRSVPRVVIQVPSRIRAFSVWMLRASPIIRPQASSGVAWAEFEVPTTGIPRAWQASRSMAALRMPAVTTSLRFGSRSMRSALNGLRSRMTQTMS